MEKKKELIKNIYESITKENQSVYRDLFENTEIETTTDAYWKEALKLYGELSNENKEIFFKIIKQVEIDAVSNILGILDGTVGLENGAVELDLNFKNSNEKINGDLQDMFLVYDEENRIE